MWVLVGERFTNEDLPYLSLKETSKALEIINACYFPISEILRATKIEPLQKTTLKQNTILSIIAKSTKCLPRIKESKILNDTNFNLIGYLNQISDTLERLNDLLDHTDHMFIECD